MPSLSTTSDPLEEATILRTASRLAQTDLSSTTAFRPALGVLLTALVNEARLTKAGARDTSAELASCLVGQARMAAAVAHDPSILNEPLPAPVFIVGLPRSGTTLLHNLFAANPASRTLRRWELRDPIKPPGAGPEWDSQRVSETERHLEVLYRRMPSLFDMHPMAATAPDECSWLLRQTFTFVGFCTRYHLPSYLTWLMSAEMTPVYRHYRIQVQCQMKRGRGSLVLKDPAHLWNLEALLSVFPDARIIWIHRALQDVVPSFCSLSQLLRSLNSDDVDPIRVGEDCVATVTAALQRAARALTATPREVVVHVDYRALVADPIGVTRALHTALDRSFDAGAEANAARWLDSHPPSRHRYDLSRFGLCEKDLDEMRSLDHAR